jgi:ankyrin repeat protein
MTPLHRAALMGETDVIKVLVEAGASLSAVYTNNTTLYYKSIL